MEHSLHSSNEQDLSPTVNDFEASEQAVFVAYCSVLSASFVFSKGANALAIKFLL